MEITARFEFRIEWSRPYFHRHDNRCLETECNVFVTLPILFSARGATMDVQSEVIKPINDELDEKTGSNESGRSDNNESDLEDGIEPTTDIGRISLEFADADAEKYSAYPISYYTFSAKERLLLIFTENFRRQFKYTYPERKPLVLAIPNECAIQKFVSTTVRPMSFLFNELIDCWEGPARFVSDFITYETLENRFEIVSKTHLIFFLFFIFINFFIHFLCFFVYTFITY